MHGAPAVEERSFVWPRSDDGMLGLFHNFQPISSGSFACRERACRKLDGRIGSNGTGNPPRSDVVARLYDTPAARHEGDIDGKSHEERVNRVRRGDDHRLGPFEALTPEQATPPARRVECCDELIRQDPLVAGVP